MELKGLERFTSEEQQLIYKAYCFAKENHDKCTKPRRSGEPYITHPVAVAKILIGWNEDVKTVVAGLLHDILEDTPINQKQLAKEFGKDIANLVDSVTKVTNFDISKEEITFATDRKFMIALTRDVRTAKIKLADRLHNMRTSEFWNHETQIRKSKENFAVYIPVAESIGAWRVKQELEDISFCYLKPDEYQLNKDKVLYVQNSFGDRVASAKKKISRKLKENNIDVIKIKEQYKSAWGLYQAITLKEQKILRLEDLISIKIILNDVKDCYSTLGVVNKLFHTKKVTDLISSPKLNGYQSLHSHSVISEDFNALIKIRDYLMEQKATNGLSYEEYKKIGGMKLFQVISTLQKTELNNQDFLQTISQMFYGEKVVFFDLSGRRYELPLGATVTDAAYFLHTEIGSHMNRASINGELVLFDHELKDGDTIKVFKDKEMSLETLKMHLEAARTNYTKAAIKRKLTRVK